jgi:hypothetical protein
MINSTTLWASQLAALNAQRPIQPNAVTNLFGSSAATRSAAGSSATSSSANDLFAELISVLTSGSTAVNGATAATAATNATSASSAFGISHPHAHAHGHGHGQASASSPTGVTASADSSTTTSAATSATSTAATSATTSADVANLKSALNKWMTDLGGINGASVRNSLHLLA